MELEDLRNAGVHIISIGNGTDFLNGDDWLKIQFQFLINEMLVTDTSKKVRSGIKRRQADDLVLSLLDDSFRRTAGGSKK